MHRGRKTSSSGNGDDQNARRAPNCISRGFFALKMRPKFGVAEDSVREIEVRAVEQVEDLPAELQLVTAPASAPCLRQREIDVRESRADDAVARRAAERKRRRQGKGRGVEPAIGRSARRPAGSGRRSWSGRCAGPAPMLA